MTNSHNLETGTRSCRVCLSLGKRLQGIINDQNSRLFFWFNDFTPSLFHFVLILIDESWRGLSKTFLKGKHITEIPCGETPDERNSHRTRFSSHGSLTRVLSHSKSVDALLTYALNVSVTTTATKTWFRFLSIPSSAGMLFPCSLSHLRFRNLSSFCIKMSIWKSDLSRWWINWKLRGHWVQVFSHLTSEIWIYETWWTWPPCVISNMSPLPPLLRYLSFESAHSLSRSNQH